MTEHATTNPAAPSYTAPPEPDDTPPGGMSFLEHFEELRQRLFRALGALIVTTILASLFTTPIIKYLAGPYEGDLIILTPTGSVVMYFKVALMSGAIVAIPFITYQLFMFILPALTDKEKRWVYLSLPATTVFFLVGVAFAWFVMVPSALGFLQTFQDEVFTDQWTAQEYFSFLTAILFWIGAAFEMPVVFFVLARMGVVQPDLLIDNWRIAVVIITVAAAVITPTVDPFNMLLVMAPLLVLYGLSILLVSLAARQRQAT